MTSSSHDCKYIAQSVILCFQMNTGNKPGIHAVAYVSRMLHISVSSSLQNPYTGLGTRTQRFQSKPLVSHPHPPTHTHTHHSLVVGPEGLLLGSQGASLVWWRHFVCSRGRLQQTPEEMPISYWLCYGLEERGGETDGNRREGQEKTGEKERDSRCWMKKEKWQHRHRN